MISSFALVFPLLAATFSSALDYRVVVGGPGLLAYTPPTVEAKVGDTITFEFHEKNHTVTQAAFDSPCSPLGGGFDSGFMPVAPGTTYGFPTYTVTVKDDKPIWAYCRQKGPPAHCQSGMVFAANAPSSGNTFDAFKAKAMASGSASSESTSSQTSTSSSAYASSTGTSKDHVVVVGGPNLLAYTPPTVNAAIGDTITFEFHEKNHTVTQAAFDSPCSPLGGGFDSGFNFVTPGTSSGFPSFTITVKDDKPIWAYCRQPGPPAHCQSGMVWAANAPSSGNTFDAFRNKALALGSNSTSTQTSTSAFSSSTGSPKDHRVVVGGPGLLNYTPPTVAAAIGDTITFEFHEKNHTVTQAAFDSPCSPLGGGFDSGFMPVAPGTSSGFPTYTITVKDDKPIWAYCRQPGPPAHCQSGMVWAANAPSSGNTFDAFRNKALALNNTTASGGYNTDSGSYTTGSAGSYSSGSESYTVGSDSGYNSGAGSYTTAPPAQVTVTVTQTVTESDRTYTTTYTTTTPYSSAAASATSSPYNGNPGSDNSAPVTHTIVVGGSAGLVFTPNTVDAAVGDIVEFQFQVKNHTVTQSPFSNPCTKLEKASNGTQIGFSSGFMFVAADAMTFPTFRITVNDTKPIWGYCGQQGPPVHCLEGMVFGVNSPKSGANTFAAFQQLAMHSNATVLSASST